MLNIARGIALGLEYLHSLQIIHADVKLANILLSTALQAKIADFGHAHVAPNGCLCNASVTHFAQSQMIAAPETYHRPKNARVISNKVDVWSFGCVLYTLTTGKLPLNRIKSDWEYLDEQKAKLAVYVLLTPGDERLLVRRELLRYRSHPEALQEVCHYFI